MKWLIVSDTHGSLDRVKTILQTEKFDYVFHAGDYTCDVHSLKALHPNLYFCLGNNDFDDEGVCDAKNATYVRADDLHIIKIGSWTLGLTHGDQQLDSGRGEADFWQLIECYNLDFLIHGHTHAQYIQKVNNAYLLNPGSINYPRTKTFFHNRWDYYGNYAVIEINDGQVSVHLRAII